MKTHCYQLPIRILLCREDGVWVAHGLEVDLLGYGDTEKEAISEFQEALTAQLTFASQQDKPEMVVFPAPGDLIQRWESANKAQFLGAITDDVAKTAKVKAVCIGLDREEMARRGKKLVFSRAPETSLA